MTRKHDLPPRWDDEPVTWTPWKSEPHTTLVFHTPLKDQACRVCGSLDTGQVAAGVIGGIVQLQVTRCDCGLDTVYDRDADEAWTLDADDYGDTGSIDPSQVQGALF